MVGTGLVILFVQYRKQIGKWQKSPPKWPTHATLRLVLGIAGMAIVFFVLSACMVRALPYVIANTVLLTSMFAAILIYLYLAAQKYAKK